MSEVFVKETGAGKLNVEKKFEELVASAMGPESPYIRAKDSMIDYFEKGDLTSKEKSELISQMVGTMASTMTTQLMDLAIKVETEDRDAPYALAKVVADVKATETATKKAEIDTKLVEASIDKVKADIAAIDVNNKVSQATVYSKTGLKVFTDGDARGLPTYTQATSATDVAQVKSAETSRYVSLAGSYRNNGNFTGYTDGATTLTPAAGYQGLVDANYKVAVRTEKGFDDNAIQHAVNSCANTVGMLVGSQNSELMGAGGKGEAILNDYVSSLDVLVATSKTSY